MKKILMVLAVLAATPMTAATANDDCSAPRADWQPREAVTRLAEQKDWVVRKIKVDDGCYEIKGRDRDGRRIEVEINPATLEIMELEYEDDDDRGTTRKPAPASTVAPPQDTLFGNGAPPKATVR